MTDRVEEALDLVGLLAGTAPVTLEGDPETRRFGAVAEATERSREIRDEKQARGEVWPPTGGPYGPRDPFIDPWRV